MKIIIIGGTGLIGSKTVPILRRSRPPGCRRFAQKRRQHHHGGGGWERPWPARRWSSRPSPAFALIRRQQLWSLEFFQTSGRNLFPAETAAGIRHHVALSIVGTDRTPENGYFRAKLAQEKLIAASGIPYTIIRATQFMEFLGGIADSATEGNTEVEDHRRELFRSDRRTT